MSNKFKQILIQLKTFQKDEIATKLLFIFGECRYLEDHVWILMAIIASNLFRYSIFKEWTQLLLEKMDSKPVYMKLEWKEVYSICKNSRITNLLPIFILFSCSKDMWIPLRRRWKRPKEELSGCYMINKIVKPQKFIYPKSMKIVYSDLDSCLFESKDNTSNYILSGDCIFGKSLNPIFCIKKIHSVREKKSSDMLSSGYSTRGIVAKTIISTNCLDRLRKGDKLSKILELAKYSHINITYTDYKS